MNVTLTKNITTNYEHQPEEPPFKLIFSNHHFHSQNKNAQRRLSKQERVNCKAHYII